MSDSTVYNLLKCTDMRIHAAADVRTTSGASPKYLYHANGGNHSNDSSGLHVTDGNSGSNRNTGFAFVVSASSLGLVSGETYAFSAELSSLSTNGESNGLQVYQHSSDSWWTGKRSYASWASGAGTYHVSFKYDGSAYVYLLFSVGVGGSATVTRFGLYHAASAAWAPAEGEELAGGGCVHER